MFHVLQLRINLLKFLQWESMGVFMIFPMLEIGDIFGINTDLRINNNSIPYSGMSKAFIHSKMSLSRVQPD